MYCVPWMNCWYRIPRAVARLDNLPAVVIEYHRPVVLSSVGDSLLEPPTPAIVAGSVDGDAAVHPRSHLDQAVRTLDTPPPLVLGCSLS